MKVGGKRQPTVAMTATAAHDDKHWPNGAIKDIYRRPCSFGFGGINIYMGVITSKLEINVGAGWAECVIATCRLGGSTGSTTEWARESNSGWACDFVPQVRYLDTKIDAFDEQI